MPGLPMPLSADRNCGRRGSGLHLEVGAVMYAHVEVAIGREPQLHRLAYLSAQ
jgi:hypothetical protein